MIPVPCGCDWHTKRGREELSHVRGQGQKPGGPHARRVAAKRSYPTSEVRGSGRECQAETAQKRPRGATLHLRSGGAAERSYPASEVRGSDERSYPESEVRGGGQEELPHTRGQGRWPGGPTPCPRSSGCTGAGGPRGATSCPRSGGRPRGVTLHPRSGEVAGRSNPCPRPGAAARRTNPTSKEPWLCGRKRA